MEGVLRGRGGHVGLWTCPQRKVTQELRWIMVIHTVTWPQKNRLSMIGPILAILSQIISYTSKPPKLPPYRTAQSHSCSSLQPRCGTVQRGASPCSRCTRKPGEINLGPMNARRDMLWMLALSVVSPYGFNLGCSKHRRSELGMGQWWPGVIWSGDWSESHWKITYIRVLRGC